MPQKQTKKKTAAASKKTAAKKTQKKTAKQPDALRYAFLFRYVLGFFAIFVILTFFPQIDSGLLGGVREILMGLFGFGYYFFPFFLLLAVFRWKRDRENGVLGARTVLTVCDFLFLLCIVHLVAVRTQEPFDYSSAVKSFDGLYASGKSLASAGAIGGSLCALIACGIGSVATAILSAVGIFVCTVLLCGSTPMATLRAIWNFFRNLSLPGIEEDEEPAPVPKQKKIPAVPAEDPSEKNKEKRAVPTVLVDDRAITDEATDDKHIVREKNGQHRFILPEEEQEEVFSRVPVTLFDRGKEKEKGTTAGTASDKSPAPGIPEPPPAVTEEPLFEEDLPLDAPFADEKEPDGEPADEPAIPPCEPAELPEEPTDEPETQAVPLEIGENPPAPYVFPPLSLLTPSEGDAPKPTAADVNAVSRKLEAVLESFKVKARVIGASFGPTVTRYEVQPETGVRVKQIANLSDDIALHLAATSVRIENIPGKSAIGIEIPNHTSSVVRLRGLLENNQFREHKSKLVTALGEDVSGNPIYLDIARMPHLMIAGATGMGKSVCMNSLIVSLLYHASPDDVKFIMIDPKKVEMADYNGIPHLLVPVINDAKKAAGTLNWACVEMEKRYNLIQEVAAKNLIEYNQIVKDDPEREQQPYIVIFIDELADLMMTAPDDVETSICRLAQKARAAGIHLVIGTQRPSVDVITGLIKANIPSRIAFTVASQVDSRTILDLTGAEKLLGRGDMLYYPVGAMKPIRVQGALVDGKSEVVAVTQFIKDAATSSYDESIIEQIEKEAKLCGAPKHARRAEAESEDGGEQKLDEKFLDALELAIDTQNISTSMIQTRLGLGYARAARIVGVMEQKGYIGPFDSATKKRKIIITREELMEMKMGKADEPSEE